MKSLLGAALLLAGLAYPFWVHAMMERAQPAWIMLPMAALWLLRTLVPGKSQPGGRVPPLLALIGCLVFAFIGTTTGLRWYPVLINAIMLAIFGSSLRYGRPLIERIARMQHPDLPPEGVRYTRKVTQVWVGFFIFNGLMATGLALWGPWSWWTAYNGCISYILTGVLFAGEWLVRPRFEKGPHAAPSGLAAPQGGAFALGRPDGKNDPHAAPSGLAVPQGGVFALGRPGGKNDPHAAPSGLAAPQGGVFALGRPGGKKRRRRS